MGTINCKKHGDNIPATGKKFPVCSECAKAKVVSWRRRQKLKAIEYKGGCCEVCGYNKCPAALSFHHKDPSEKDFGISSGKIRGWDKIKIELDKCMLVCNNCHAEIHYQQNLDI